jgi:hypothetical protein
MEAFITKSLSFRVISPVLRLSNINYVSEQVTKTDLFITDSMSARGNGKTAGLNNTFISGRFYHKQLVLVSAPVSTGADFL